MLLSGKPFFLRGADDLTVNAKGRGAIVIERGDTDNVHLEKRVDERCNGRTLRKHDKPPKHNEYYQERQHPELLSHPKKSPKLTQESCHFFCQRGDRLLGRLELIPHRTLLLINVVNDAPVGSRALIKRYVNWPTSEYLAS